MKQAKLLLILFALWTVAAPAFIPPLPAIFKEIYDGRKPGAVEAIFRHRVEVKPGEAVEIDEQIVKEAGRYYVLWKGTGVTAPIPATWDRHDYTIAPDRTIPSRSAVFVKYFLGSTPEDFRDQLLAEQFLRRDQLQQYKSGFYVDGDPQQNWDLRGGYLRHSDIFLRRLGEKVAITVVGLDEPALKKTIFIDRGLRGVRRLEWKDGQNIAAWNFDVFVKMGGGHYPKRLSFESDGREAVTSDLLAVRVLKDKALNDFKNNWRQADRTTPAPANYDAALRLLLSYR